MYINSNLYSSAISFGQIRKEYKNEDIKAKEQIREHLTKPLGTTFKFQEELGNMTINEAKAFIAMQTEQLPKIKEEDSIEKPKEAVHVDVQALNKRIKKNSNYYRPNQRWELPTEALIEGFDEIIKDKLYVGQSLGSKPEVAHMLKKANINSVLYLLKNDQYYKENALNAGLNYMDIGEIGNGTLGPYNFDVIEKLAKQPELYANTNNEDVEDLKSFINIVNGNDEDMPGPLYMGCSYVTKVTPRWCEIYKILKNQSQDQPLTQDRAEKLLEFLSSIEYGLQERW